MAKTFVAKIGKFYCHIPEENNAGIKSKKSIVICQVDKKYP
jgi:hypothetical protein